MLPKFQGSKQEGNLVCL